MTSVYKFAEQAQKTIGPFSTVEEAVKGCAANAPAVIFIGGDLLDSLISAGLKIKPSSIEEALLGHIGYIDTIPVVTNKFTLQSIAPEWNNGVYILDSLTK